MGEEAYMPVFSSHAAVYGDYERQWYMERGVTEDRIAVAGHPQFDEIISRVQTAKSLPTKGHPIPDKITLLAATGPLLNAAKIERLLHLLAQEPQFHVVIKPHPWELGKKKYQQYLRLEEQYPQLEVITDRKVKTYDLLANADGVVTSLSTMTLEGLLFDKPVFVYDFIISNRSYPYHKRLGDYYQTEPELLLQQIKRYYTEPEERTNFNRIRRSFLTQSYPVKDAGARLVQFIEDLKNARLRK